MLCNNNNMKYIKMSTFIYVCELLCLTLCLPMSHTVSGDKQHICCVPEEWEGTMYLDYGTVFIDSNTAFSYINGTVRIAYSVSNKKIYLGIKGVEQSPLSPKPMPWDSEMLYDFSKVSNILFNQSKKEGKDQTHNVSYPR